MKAHNAWVALLGLMVLAGACVLQSETVAGTKGESGPRGEPGAKGDKGDPGVVDAAMLAALQAQVDALQTKVDALEKQQVADPECPLGYQRDTAETVFIVCKKGSPAFDEIVKVGTGASAFWIDRYEASVWSTADDPGDTPWGKSNGDYPSSFLSNGQWTTPKRPAFALGKSGVMPSRYITWFQASEACRASGKRLPSGEEWLTAARGTPDPGAFDGKDGGKCNTASMANGPRKTGMANLGSQNHCLSSWGAEDMIGNLHEWTSEWYAGVGDGVTEAKWPAGYGSDDANDTDRTWNIASTAYVDNVGWPGVPSAATRGGAWNSGTGAGVFTFELGSAPTRSYQSIGFRCVIPR